jgi:hypothetical protein
MKKIKSEKVANKKPAKIAKASSSVKDHNAGKVRPIKPAKAKNMPSNYGVKS